MRNGQNVLDLKKKFLTPKVLNSDWFSQRQTCEYAHTSYYYCCYYKADRLTNANVGKHICMFVVNTHTQILQLLSQSHIPTIRPTMHSYSSGVCSVCACRPYIWHAEEWEVRISRGNRRGRQKWPEGDDEIGWYGLFSSLKCTLLSFHAYVCYSGVTR